MSARPTPEEERSQFLYGEVRRWEKSGVVTPAEAASLRTRWKTRWSSSRLISRAVFFGLICLAVSSFTGFLHLIDLPLAGTIGGIASIAVAEMMIRKRSIFHAGMDEGLWLAGLISAITDLPSTGSDESILVVGSAFLIAGVRMLNPLFNFVAVCTVVAWIGMKTDSAETIALVLLTGAAVASLMMLRRLRRPSTEFLLAMIAALFPPAAYVAYLVGSWRWREVLTSWDLVLFAAGTALLVTGLLRRIHAPVVGALLLLALIMWDGVTSLRLTWDVQAMALGAAVFLVALVTDRVLRNRQSGLTSRQLLESDVLRLAELGVASATAAAHQPSAQPAAPAGVQTGGGEFGGAGASGEY